VDPAGLEDLFRPVASVRVKRMFGGHGVYADELFFALEIRGTVYLKVDERTQDRFREAGSAPFAYAGAAAKRITVAAFWRLPDIAFDDEGELIAWSRLALEAAARTKAAKAARAPARPRRTTKKGRAG
jgi:DNA transformation protein